MKTLSQNDPGAPGKVAARAVVLPAATERFVLKGQMGLGADGQLTRGMRAQMDAAWSNMFALLTAAGFEREHLVHVTVHVTETGRTQLFREIRDQHLGGHVCVTSYRHVSGLLLPAQLCELDAEAVR